IIKQVEDDFGSIDILINHAAVEPRVSLLDMDEWDWHRVLDVNLTGTFLTMQSVGRVMREKGSGVIVNLVTAPASGSRNEAAYTASLHGLIGLTRQASLELSEYNIHVHAVGTGIAEFHHADAGIPRSLIEAVLYLCKSSLNGQIVNVEER
ncbi:MAG: SDR family oxidoreductase, partial [Chloroflexi bacterium]|nr:SDR family oxidoreductase [Chloroflexota bacterium]